MSVLSNMKRDLSTTNHAAEDTSPVQLYAEMMQQRFPSEFMDLDGSVDGSMQKLLYLGETNGNKSTADLTKVPSPTQPPATLARAVEAEQPLLANTSFPCNVNQDNFQTDPVAFPGQLDRGTSLLSDRVSAMDSPDLSPACYLESPQWSRPGFEDIPPQLQSTKAQKGKSGGKKTSWKPNNDQLRVLEPHLNSGKPFEAQKVLKALQQHGRVTSAQLSAWLRNRRSKAKALAAKPEKDEKSDGSENSLLVNGKRCREGDLEKAFNDFDQDLTSAMSEMTSILGNIKGNDVRLLCRALLHARNVVCHSVGTEGYVMQAFAWDLNQIGIKSFYLTDISMPQISEDDIFLVSAAPSFYATVSALALEAKRLGARVIAFTAHPSADMLFADDIIRIPAQTLTPSMPILSKKSLSLSETVSFLPDGDASVLNLGDSYTLGLKITQEAVIAMLRSKLNSTIL